MKSWRAWRTILNVGVLCLGSIPMMGAPTPTSGPSVIAQSAPASIVPGHFVDITDKSGVTFLHQAPHTSRKYLIETMGSGVGLFDCDNDGRLDLYLVNGAPFSDPEPKGSIPQKKRPRILEPNVSPETGWDI
jgi:hypothetical protein